MPDSLDEWVRKITRGEALAVARAITAVENRDPGAIPLLKRLFAAGRHARVIGVTGATGVGKSTLAGKLAESYNQEGLRVGVLAVDPSSPFSGGAILGDRIRMPRLAESRGIFIRSMASRGSDGGIASATADAVTVLDAARSDVILIETVGAGQDELDIAMLADVTLLVLVPGFGDEVQALKAGIMEIADVFVVNKADRGGADETERQLQSVLSLTPRGERWRPSVIKASASSSEGIEKVKAAIEDFRAYAAETLLSSKRDQARWRARLLQLTRQRFLERFFQAPEIDAHISAEVDAIRRGDTDPYRAADELFDAIALHAAVDREGRS